MYMSLHRRLGISSIFKHLKKKLVVSIVYLKQSSYKGSEMSVYVQMCYTSKIVGFYIFKFSVKPNTDLCKKMLISLLCFFINKMISIYYT